MYFISGAAGHLGAFAGTQFDIVHRRAQRNILQGQGIADQNVRFRSCNN